MKTGTIMTSFVHVQNQHKHDNGFKDGAGFQEAQR